MSDKFRVNAFYCIPTAIIHFIYFVIGANVKSPECSRCKYYQGYHIPYLVVPITAICGMNVMVVLTIGIALCGIWESLMVHNNMYGWLVRWAKVSSGTGELVIIGDVGRWNAEIIRENGGIDPLLIS